MAGATRNSRASTKRNYADALQHARDLLGDKRLRALTKSDIEGLVDHLLTAGRRRGGKPGTGLSGRTVRLTLGRLTAALDMAVAEGKRTRSGIPTSSGAC